MKQRKTSKIRHSMRDDVFPGLRYKLRFVEYRVLLCAHRECLKDRLEMKYLRKKLIHKSGSKSIPEQEQPFNKNQHKVSLSN